MKLITLEHQVAALKHATRMLEGNATFGSERQARRQARGYGAEWDKLRVRILKRDSYQCQQCLRGGMLQAARQVDHIVPKSDGGTDDPSNLQSLCRTCHEAKTLRENARRGIRFTGGVG